MDTFIKALVGFWLVLATGAASAAGGTVTAASDAFIVRGQGEQPLRGGEAVRVGDELGTRSGGRVQWRMDDNAVSALGGDSRFKIESFAMPGGGDGIGRSVMRLLRGSFRSISGLIGKASRDVYEVHTPIATMGIRGTTYAAALCESNCKGGDAENPVDLADGLYVAVDVGLVEVSNAAGTLLVPAGKRAYVASKTTAPVFVDVWPNLFFELERQMTFDAFGLPTEFGNDLELRVFEASPDQIDPPASGS